MGWRHRHDRKHGTADQPQTGTVNQTTFNSINAAGNYPYISVTYDHYPNTPENLVLKDQHVATNAYVNTTTPTFSAYVTDPDGGTENAAYTLTDTTTSTVLLNKVLGSSSTNDGTSTYTVSGGIPLTNGHDYQVQVWGYDGTANSKYPDFDVHRRLDAPSTPTVSSSTYTSGAWTNSASGPFTFTSSSSDVQTCTTRSTARPLCPWLGQLYQLMHLLANPHAPCGLDT